MVMGLRNAAEAIRKKGQKNAPGDSMLAHITPEEAQILRMMGGSGEVDRETGLPHFAQDIGGGNDDNDNDTDPEKNKDKTDSKPSNSGGGGGGWNNYREPSPEQKAGFAANRAAFKERAASGQVDTRGWNTRNAPSAERSREGTSSDLPANMNQDARLKRQAAFGTSGNPEVPAYDPDNPVKTTRRPTAASVVKLGLAGLASVATENPMPLANAVRNMEYKTEWDTWNETPGANPGDAHNAGSIREQPGPQKQEQQPQTQPQTPVTPPVVPTTTDQQQAEDTDSMDDPFVRGARRRRGYTSTIAAGSAGGSSITMGKTLLGS